MSRFFEILPGALAWCTLFAMVFLSWKIPVAVAVFIIAFDIYWLLKTIFLSFHIRSTFKKVKENLKIDWLETLQHSARRESHNGGDGRLALRDWQSVYHLIILPMHHEPYEVVRESFESLRASHYPKEKFIVVLAIEERAGAEAERTAERIQKEFGSDFFRFLVTKHPSGLRGETPGKGSNETWAGKKAKELVIDPLHIPHGHVLVSVFDVDTQVYPEYFGVLTHAFLTAPHPLRSVYQPVPLFTNNIYQAPAIARVVAFSSTFWQMMQQSRPERLTTFSSQSIPLRVLIDIGFWHTNVVSEDSRIFWQGYLHYHGDFRVVPLSYPVSMDANVAWTLFGTMKNLYKQQRRWGWGVENIPYLLMGFRKDPKIPFRKKAYWSFNIIEGFYSWATSSLMIFALGWLPVILGGHAFRTSILSYSLPKVTGFIIQLSMVGIATSAILGMLLLPPKPAWFRARHYVAYALQWIFIPVTLILFGAVPALESQTRLMLGGKWRLGFWVTPKGRYPETGKGSGKRKFSRGGNVKTDGL